MRTYYAPRRRPWRRNLFFIAVLAFIVGAALVTYGVAQQHPTVPGNTLPGNTPAPLQPVQVQTSPNAPNANPSFTQQVGDVVDNLKKGANDAATSIEAEYGKARDAIQSMGIQARVYSRLHWDKDLANASLSINSPSNGVVSLSGSVPNAVAKTKAIKLAEDTVGVTKVIDQLSSSVPATTTPTVP